LVPVLAGAGRGRRRGRDHLQSPEHLLV